MFCICPLTSLLNSGVITIRCCVVYGAVWEKVVWKSFRWTESILNFYLTDIPVEARRLYMAIMSLVVRKAPHFRIPRKAPLEHFLLSNGALRYYCYYVACFNYITNLIVRFHR